MDAIDKKLDFMRDEIAGIKTHLAVNTVSLQEHMRRTELLERRLDSVPQKVLMITSIVGGLITIFKLVVH